MRTIILVDDDPDVLVTIGEMLSRSGHYVIARSDAESALSAIRETGGIDLIIADYQMPGMDGGDFMMTLRGLVPSVPVIVLTAHGSIDLYIKSMSLGAFEYITKPVRIKELNRIVGAALERPQGSGGELNFDKEP